HVKERMLRDLKAAGTVDGVLLDLHGAMVTEGHDDGEGDLISAVRQVVGPSVPIAVSLDFHGNITDTMVREADLLHGYKTYPHVDMGERGVEATERLLDVIGQRLRPTAALRKPPLLPPLGNQGTARGPMRRLYAMAEEMERDPKVISISVFAGFPHADIPEAGFGGYVVTDNDQALADRLADQIADTAWANRHEFMHAGLPVREAGARALAPQGQPLVLGGMAHNTGGGAAGGGGEGLGWRGGRRDGGAARARAGGRPLRGRRVHLGSAGGRPLRGSGGGRLRHPRRGRQGRSAPRRASARHRPRAHPLRRALRAQGADGP